jgi:hypothetical protein
LLFHQGVRRIQIVAESQRGTFRLPVIANDMKQLIVGLVCLACLDSSFAQVDSTHKGYARFFAFGVGLVHHEMYDDAMSTVRYHGTLAAPLFGHLKFNDKKYSQWDLHGSFMKYKTKLSNELVPMAMTNVRFALDYQRLQRVSKWSSKFDIRAGGTASLLFNFKQAPQLDNSQLVYEYAISAGLGGMASKEIQLFKRDWLLRYNLQWPLLAYLYRPPYMNRVEFFNPENELVGYTLRNSELGTLNRYLRINSAVSFTKKIRNGNAVKIGYGWDFYRIKTISRVFHTEHLLSFTLLTGY